MRRFPELTIENSVAPVDEETVRGLRPGVPFIVKVEVDVVALIPATVPLSIEIPDDTVFDEVQRVRKPFVPPERDPPPPEIPREDVETHWVDVPVDQST
jgi:hypothetical protein